MRLVGGGVRVGGPRFAAFRVGMMGRRVGAAVVAVTLMGQRAVGVAGMRFRCMRLAVRPRVRMVGLGVGLGHNNLDCTPHVITGTMVAAVVVERPGRWKHMGEPICGGRKPTRCRRAHLGT